MNTSREIKIEEIRKKCIEVNPEIVELKFGCLIKNPNKLLGTGILVEADENEKFISWQIHYPDMNDDIFCSFKSKNRGTSWHKPITPNYEILGRPIRLADVLLAITMHDPIRYIAISAPGSWLEIKNGKYQNCMEDGMQAWDLLKDSLTDQSDDCINFIHSLISQSKEE